MVQHPATSTLTEKRVSSLSGISNDDLGTGADENILSILIPTILQQATTPHGSADTANVLWKTSPKKDSTSLKNYAKSRAGRPCITIFTEYLA